MRVNGTNLRPSGEFEYSWLGSRETSLGGLGIRCYKANMKSEDQHAKAIGVRVVPTENQSVLVRMYLVLVRLTEKVPGPLPLGHG